MGAGHGLIVPLDSAARVDEARIGGKAAKLARLKANGVRVATGWCITAEAYDFFVRASGLDLVIRRELERKPFASMRWEELWDAALRIRAVFLQAPMPGELERALRDGPGSRTDAMPFAVRSSSPSEDTKAASFAGLHESFLDVRGADALVEAVRLVWSSLWSDASLLYRRELGLDPSQSRMAVLVQSMVTEDCSGVAFGCDPVRRTADRALVEAVPGLCSGLVDGEVDPDRWVLERPSGRILEWKPGDRQEPAATHPILSKDEIADLYRLLVAVEAEFQWAADLEWTGRRDRITVLQARPVSTAAPEPDDPRSWYLRLRPGLAALTRLEREVSGTLIPELAATGARFASEPIESLSDESLAGAIEERCEALGRWRRIYEESFIPFAHGARFFGAYYNDCMRPADPYEFVRLLRGEPMLATERNRMLSRWAAWLEEHRAVRELLERRDDWETLRARLLESPDGTEFLSGFTAFMEGTMDLTHGDERLSEHPRHMVDVLLGVTATPETSGHADPGKARDDAALEARFLAVAGPEPGEEAREVLRIARASWRLRDDDNLLLSRVESQCLRAIREAARRLGTRGRLRGEGPVAEAAAGILARELRNPGGGPVELPAGTPGPALIRASPPGESPRQLVGQPASPGVATAPVRRIRTMADLEAFRPGDVLVTDAVQPMMTHLVPLAAAIVERRGGMLIHSAIIARELGIPCVNGVRDVVDILVDGEVITVDGDLGIVTVGEPEFRLELGRDPKG